MGEWEEGKEGGVRRLGGLDEGGERYFQLSPPLPHSPPRCLSWITVTVTCSTSSRTPCASRTHGSWAWSSPPPDRPPPGPPQPQAARKTRAVPATQEEEAREEEAELQAEGERGLSSLGCIPPRDASAMPVRPLWQALTCNSTPPPCGIRHYHGRQPRSCTFVYPMCPQLHFRSPSVPAAPL